MVASSTGADREVTISPTIPLSSYDGKIVVVKIGGSEDARSTSIFQDIVHLRSVGADVIIVHGGGKALSEWLNLVGLQSAFIEGIRVTDAKTLELAVMVFAGKINKEIISLLSTLGIRAVGISGIDAGILKVEPETDPPGLGLVGRIVGVDSHLLDHLIASGMTPVIAPVAADQRGQMYNINADTVASEIAAALTAETIVFVTDVPGVLDACGKLIPKVTPAIARQLLAEGTINSGMIPKVEAALAPLSKVAESHIIDGSSPNSLIDQLRHQKDVGTRFALS